MAGDGDGDGEGDNIRVCSMRFAYEMQPPLFMDFNLSVAPGSRENNLVKILVVKHMVGGRNVVRMLKCFAFYDTRLACSGDLSYLGGSRSKTVGSAVLLLDEVTVDLDVVTRMDFLEFLTEECDQRGATIVYATNIFDGLETWATHLVSIQDRELRKAERLSDIEELKDSANLHSVVKSWLRSETKQSKRKFPDAVIQTQKPSLFGASPLMSSRHMAYYR